MSAARPRVLLATMADLPGGEPGGELLEAALERRGVEARWAVWSDPTVDWAAADLVAVRSTWDYERRREEFLGWARAVASRTRLVNPPHVLAWNTDKGYLLELADAGLPVVPTLLAEDELDLPSVLAELEPAVVKPRVGAGGRGVVVFDGRSGGPAGLDESQLTPGPWVVQPLLSSVRTRGETSVFVLGGEAVSQVVKVPAGDEIRVHEEYGGRSRPVPVEEAPAALSRRTVRAAEELLGTPLLYARVDLMYDDADRLVVSELELVEPGLYLDVLPGNAERFAEALTG